MRASALRQLARMSAVSSMEGRTLTIGDATYRWDTGRAVFVKVSGSAKAPTEINLPPQGARSQGAR